MALALGPGMIPNDSLYRASNAGAAVTAGPPSLASMTPRYFTGKVIPDQKNNAYYGVGPDGQMTPLYQNGTDENGQPRYGYLEDAMKNPAIWTGQNPDGSYIEGSQGGLRSVWGNAASADSLADKIANAGIVGTAAVGAGMGVGGGLAGLTAPEAAATGAIEAAPVIGGAGEPLLTGIASGADPFVDTGVLGASGAAASPYADTAGGLAGVSGGAAAGAAGAGAGSAAVQGGLAGALARGIPGVAGAVASKQQSDAYERLSREYMALGAPSRGRFEASFAPGFTMASDPGYKDALDQTTKATLHGLSVTGNPADSPNAWMQTLSDVNSKFAYPALQNYRNMNAGAGGLAALTAAAPGAASASIGAQGQVLNSLGGAAADIFNPPKSLSDLLREYRASGY